jgi:pimeloyl-ACP methyl ester carboxylesterase
MRRAAKIVAALAGALALLLAGFVAFNWAPDRPVAELTARWAQPPSSFIDIAGSSIVVFDDLGHVPQEEDPVRTVAAARPFLESHRSMTAGAFR